MNWSVCWRVLNCLGLMIFVVGRLSVGMIVVDILFCGVGGSKVGYSFVWDGFESLDVDE